MLPREIHFVDQAVSASFKAAERSIRHGLIVQQICEKYVRIVALYVEA